MWLAALAMLYLDGFLSFKEISVYSLWNFKLNNDSKLERIREILTASSAAGVAVAFGSPVGGVLFAFEVGFFIIGMISTFQGNEHIIFQQNNVEKFLLCIGCNYDYSRTFYIKYLTLLNSYWILSERGSL